jgi:type IV secretion system protein VirD4
MTDLISGIWQVFVWCVRLAVWLVKHTLRLLRWLGRKLFAARPRTFGTARWASRRELAKAGALTGSGLIVGKVGGRFLRDNDPEGTILVFAPQGAGKGVGVVIPNLLSYPGSIIVTDPKGENFAITQAYRRSLGPVYCLNLDEPEVSDAFNPLDMLRLGTMHETDDAEILADLMLAPEPHTPPHWRDMAVKWLAGFILYVAHKNRNLPELCTLTEVHSITNQSGAALQNALQDMAKQPQAKIQETAHEILFNLEGEGSEAKSILVNLGKGTKVFARDKPPALVTGSSDFTFETLNDQTTTIYLIVPEEKLVTYRPFLRVIVGLTMNALYRAGRGRATPDYRTLLLLDEAAALGYLEPLEQGMGYLRAYARAMLIFQDLHQLKTTYPKAGSIMSNSRTQIAFGVNDFDTAEALSKRIGQETTRSRSQGHSQASTALLQHQHQAGIMETGRWLIDPAEILRLSPDQALVFMGKQVPAPILAKRVQYFKERVFRGLYQRWRPEVKPRLDSLADVGDLAPAPDVDAVLAAAPKVDDAGAYPADGSAAHQSQTSTAPTRPLDYPSTPSLNSAAAGRGR